MRKVPSISGYETQNEEKQYVQHNTTQKIKMMINTDPMQKPGVHPHACEG